MIGESLCRFQHFALSGIPLLCDGHLEEVPRIVKLVLQSHGPPSFKALFHDEVRNQESVLLLRRQDAVEHVLDSLLQFGVFELL
jgi:hypothetical protein